MNQPSPEHLREIAAELRELITEAHGALKDLRRETREARELLPLLTDELFSAEVKKQLDELSVATKQAIEDADARIGKRFDQLGDVLMGEDRQSIRQGKASLTTIARANIAQQTAGEADRE
ncbi:hypothetical protein ACFYRN_16435 [Streptomyces sp. NPDC005227]|uniref:hypothetical protein n=1 Tax=Streptomyces sp. NPDC005227 TaxID=3364707 RepID=UPI0036C22CDF